MKLPNIKHLLIGLVASAIPLIFPGGALAATLSLSPNTGTFNKGCSVQLKINLDTSGAQTDGTDAILLFNPTILTPVQTIQNGTIYPDYSNVVDALNGKVTVSGIASVAQAYSGQGTLATVNFTVNNNAAGPLTVKFDFDPNDKQKTTDSNVAERGTLADLLSSVSDGNYTVGTGSGCSGAGGTGAIGVGAPGSSDSAVVVVPPPVTVLSPSGSFDNTLILGIAGGLFVLLGIIGLSIL